MTESTLTQRQRRALLALLGCQRTREEIDRIAGASNGPAIVHKLRHLHGLRILCNRRGSHDRDGRKIVIGVYRLAPTEGAAARLLIGAGAISKPSLTSAAPGYLAALDVISTPLDALAGNASMLGSASNKVNRMYGRVTRALADPMNSPIPIPDAALLEALPHLARDLLDNERFMRSLKLQAVATVLRCARTRLDEARARKASHPAIGAATPPP